MPNPICAVSLSEGPTFLFWFLPGMALQFAIMAMASSLRATGIVKPTMIVQVLTVVLNTILAPILIAGWGPGPALGVLGAGLAGGISITFGVGLLTLYFFKLEKYVSFDPSLWRPRFDIWKKMMDIELPAGGEMLILFVYFSAVYWLIQDFGAVAQAGFSIGAASCSPPSCPPCRSRLQSVLSPTKTSVPVNPTEYERLSAAVLFLAA